MLDSIEHTIPVHSASLPEIVERVRTSYDPSSGCYRNADGSLDPCHTEIETLETWNGLLRCIKPKVVVETGVYYGLSTCYIAAALRDSGVPDAKVYSIDPWQLEHYWKGSDLEPFIEYLPLPTQEATPKLAGLSIDVLVIDSIHTYDQSSWELMTLEPQVREGGYIIMHDSLFFDGVGRTARHLYDDPRFEVITIETPRTQRVSSVADPVPMGCTIARKIRHGAQIQRDPAWIPIPEAIPNGPLPLLRLASLERSGVQLEPAAEQNAEQNNVPPESSIVNQASGPESSVQELARTQQEPERHTGPRAGRHYQLRRRLRGFFKAKGHVDAIAGNRVVGWAFADGASVRVEASVDNKVIASIVPSLQRHDIAQAFPGWGRAGKSGFVLDLPETVLPVGEVRDVTISVRPDSFIHLTRKLTEIPMTGIGTIEKVAVPPETGIVGPFPKSVIDTVAALWPDACHDLSSSGGQHAFVAKLRTILRTPSLRSGPAIADYVRFLQATWTHFKFVEKFFPAVNFSAKEESTDFHCKPNSIYEIFPIAHQLYVLKSYGIAGDFAEFGCFKGFSSAMLSFACKQLDLHMHIFDSFEGLPPSEGSGYQPGEYAGTLEEVEDNITRFGSIENVEFHKGFFSDTFRDYRPPELMCLWMDVDLELSSRDLMVVADRLDPRSTLFSHECSPDMFVEGRIVNAPRLDNPIPPMLDRFDDLQRPLTGRFVRGTTGAFWPREGGIPALDNEVLIDLVHAIQD